MTFSLVYITYPDQATADLIIEALLQEKLIAGANKLPIESAYWWHGAIQKEGEIASIMQCPTTNLQSLIAKVDQLHPYQVPCIIHWQVQANPNYEDWVESEANAKSD